MVVETTFQKWTPVATTIEITPTVEISISIAGVISMVVSMCNHYWNKGYYWNNNCVSSALHFNSGYV